MFLEAVKYLVDGIVNEDWKMVKKGMLWLNEFVEEHKELFTDEELKRYESYYNEIWTDDEYLIPDWKDWIGTILKILHMHRDEELEAIDFVFSESVVSISNGGD